MNLTDFEKRIDNIVDKILTEIENRELETLSSYQLARLAKMLSDLTRLQSPETDQELERLWATVEEASNKKLTKKDLEGVRK